MNRHHFIAVFSFAAILLSSCGRVDVGDTYGRYQIAAPESDVVYRIDTKTGELERLIEMPVLDAKTDEAPAAEYAWEKVNISTDWVNR